MAKAISEEDFIDAVDDAKYFVCCTKRLLDYFSLRNERVRKSYAVFRFVRAFYGVMTTDFNAIDAEQENYLKQKQEEHHQDRTKDPAKYLSKIDIKDYYPEADFAVKDFG